MKTVECNYCNNPVKFEDENDINYWELNTIPESLYWNTELREVYCSPECSLKRYEEIKNVN